MFWECGTKLFGIRISVETTNKFYNFTKVANGFVYVFFFVGICYTVELKHLVTLKI